jgi:hypothetical protein
MKVIKATAAPVSFDIVDNINDKITPEAIASLKKTGCGIKGEFVTGVGRGTKPSINIDLRKSMNVSNSRSNTSGSSLFFLLAFFFEASTCIPMKTPYFCVNPLRFSQ